MTEQKVITLSDGAKIAARIAGDGPPLVFVHGWAMNGDLFDKQRRAFADSHQVVTFDMRGHGASTGTGAAPTIERLGADLCEIVEQLSLREAVCVGWSMGAMVIWEALADAAFSDCVSGMVAIDMSPRLTNDSAWKLGLADGRGPQSTIRSADAMRRDWPAMVKSFVPRIFARGAEEKNKDVIAEISDYALKLDAELMANLWESMAVQDFRKSIRTLAKPLLVACGELSQLYPKATGEYLAATAPSASLVVFSHSGHAPHLEEAEKFNDSLRAFAGPIQPNLRSETRFASVSR